jgi:ADP-heptose:LPS heptosyltransferase
MVCSDLLLITMFEENGRGDVLLMTPALRLLRQRFLRHRIVVVTNHKALLINNPNVSAAVEQPSTSENYVEALLKSANCHFHIDYRPFCMAGQPHHIADIICMICGVKPDGRKPDLFLGPAERTYGRELVSAIQPYGTQPIIALHTGASTKNRQWLSRNWYALVRRFPRATFLQIGATDDTRVPGTFDLRGRLSLRNVASVLLAVDCLIATDSWLNHAAAALGRPAVILFGASHPRHFGYRSNVNIFGTSAVCAPCYRPAIWRGDFSESQTPWECPHRLCQADIRVEHVEEAVSRLLRQRNVRHLKQL